MSDRLKLYIPPCSNPGCIICRKRRVHHHKKLQRQASAQLGEKEPMTLINAHTLSMQQLEQEITYQNSRVASYQKQYDNAQAELDKARKLLNEAITDRTEARKQLRGRYNMNGGLDV